MVKEGVCGDGGMTWVGIIVSVAVVVWGGDIGGNFQPFGPQPNPIFGPPPNPPPTHNPPRTPQRSNQGSSDTQSTHMNRHDAPSRRANSLYQEDNIRVRVDDWDYGVENEGDQRYQRGWDNDNHDEGYGYQGHQHYDRPNQGYQGQPRVPRRPNVNQYPGGEYEHFHDVCTHKCSEDSESKEESDPGAPIIPIQIGEVKTNKALLDYGASVSILPGSIYDQYEFGPLHPVDITMVLADSTCKRPRGMSHPQFSTNGIIPFGT
ncbi:hypothetical protein E3N88_04730 [Mikania micrantha]|uniref:Uncharacterized protein n=1 Tax=Mikania micrantha TaxID=192012 RepID=A0A5N6PVR3_9ASTR|nr:hypothetical protein E3N88_04730 [Mikania micrantha]